jgi:malonyl-CoA O-methyltransferase
LPVSDAVPHGASKRDVRRAFDRAAATYDAAAVLQHEVCRRMAERLAYMKHEPLTILDAGCGTGNALPLLRSRYPKSRVIALDLAPAMVAATRARLPRWKSLFAPPFNVLCGDMEAMPLAAGSVQLVWSNLALQWMADLPRALGELNRVLAPGGLLMFSTFGPDTLKELRAAYSAVDGGAHVNHFIDLHDIGDMLVKARYADPVMDMEPFTLTYTDVPALMRDLKAIGANTVTEGRAPGLVSRARWKALQAAYEPLRREGKLPATYEVIYGHAWKPLPRVTASGKRIIDIKAANGH